MSLLTILEFPDPRLRKVAAPVTEFNDELQTLIENMFETMYEAPGIGLAATQVDEHIRLIVMDLSEDRSEPRVFINPEVTVLDPELTGYEEGCLSVPGAFEMVDRPRKIRVSFQDAKGEKREFEAEGLLAVCIQHELDHLEGKLFVDYISMLKRQRIKKRLEKEHKRQVS